MSGTEQRVRELPRFAPTSRSARVLTASRWRIGVAVEAVLLLLAWQILSTSGAVPPKLLPQPGAVARELGTLIAMDTFWSNSAFTTQNFLIGVLIAFAAGVPIGMAIGGAELLHMFVGPVVWAISAVPMLAISPIIVIALGLGADSKIFIVVFSAIFVVIINSMQGIRAVPANLLRAARVFGASRTQLVLRIVLPSLVPYLLVALRLAIAGGIAGAIIGEFVGSFEGLGLMLTQSAYVLNVPRVLALVIVIVTVAALALAVVHRLKVWLAPWAQDIYS